MSRTFANIFFTVAILFNIIGLFYASHWVIPFLSIVVVLYCVWIVNYNP